MLRLKSLATALCVALLSMGCGGDREVEVVATPEEQQQQQEYLNRLQEMERQFVEEGGPGAVGAEGAPGPAAVE